ncbi:hypothetical protein BC749_101157 [Flavobacterium araucananum]|uniref:Uncharacterized protein n=2 Tax=Flavobacterium araucananum TaxID=946678 RepID=A0A227PEA5_9FLAO|nr:hypothetical protein B0A64_07690 [Flavobacterium araucananum]PWK02097.1 hypothetical protein BC749_101157 [Flavobacterium araucananum]
MIYNPNEMENEIHIIPQKVEEGQQYDPKLNSLLLKKAATFAIKIKEIEDLKKQRPIAPKLLNDLSQNYNLLSETGKWNYTVNKKQYDIDLEKYNAELKVYNENLKKFDDLNWTWQLVYNGLDPNKITHYDAFTKGIHERISFPELLEGGGIAWLEAWHENEKPKGTSPFGMYVQAEGIARIVRTEWTDCRYNTINEITPVAFGSKVILHIYTAGLYGQEVDIYLEDSEAFKPNDKLKIAEKDFFNREVKVHKLKPVDLNKKGVSGILTINDAPVNYAQKIEIEVVLDSSWIKTAGENLKIFPIIKSVKTGTFFTGFSRSYLLVSTDKKSITPDQEPIPATNMPLIVGDIETNVSHFQHCRYDSVKLDGTSIFDSNNIYQRITNTINVDVIAGKKKARSLDFDFKTDECENKPVKHINKELTVLSIPKDYELKVDASSKAEHKAKKEEKELIKTESKSSSGITYMGGLKTTQKEAVPKEKGIITVKQNQIEFDAFYNYDISMDSPSRYIDVAKYFWLGNLETQGKLSKIEALANTCAFKQNVNITIYPDIKWSIVFGFNVKKDQLTTLIPSWDQKKTIEKFSWDGNKFTEKLQEKLNTETNEDTKREIQQKIDNEKNKKETLDKINQKTLDVYKNVYGEAKPKPNPVDKPNTTKGKLSTLLKIMQDVDVSIKAQIYEDTKLELTRDFFENTAALAKQYKDLFEMVKWVSDTIQGKKDTPKNKADGDKEINELLSDARSRSRIKGLEESLTRSTQEVEILYPKFKIGADWKFELVDPKKYPALTGRSGLGYNVAFMADPLIGMKITWHILDLLCRRHPIAYAVLAAVKTLLAALGDNPDGIVVDFWVQGQISTDLSYKGNVLAGPQKITAKGDAHITAGVELSINIKGELVVGKYTSVAEVGVGAKGEVGLGIVGTLGVDDEGIWTQSSLVFDGIKLTFTAIIGARVKKKILKKDGTVEEIEIVGGESKVEIEITMLEHTFESDKFYLK